MTHILGNYIPENKSLPIIYGIWHKRAIKFCKELGFSPRMKIMDTLKFKIFYFMFKNLNVFKWLTTIYIILSLNLVNTFSILIVSCIYFYKQIHDARLELTIMLLIITLVFMEMLSIVVPLCILMLIPLVIYNQQFEINLILNAELFRIVFLCLYTILALLVAFILFSNLEFIVIDNMLMMKNSKPILSVLEGTLSKTKLPKPDPNNNGTLVVTDQEANTANHHKKTSYYSTVRLNLESDLLPRICSFSKKSSEMFLKLDDNVRNSITSHFYSEVERRGGSSDISNLTTSPKFKQQAMKLFEVSSTEGPNSPVVIRGAKELAKTFCSDTFWYRLSESTGLDINQDRLMQRNYKNILNNCQLVAKLKYPEDLSKLLNNVNLITCLAKSYSGKDCDENILCAAVSIVNLHNQFNNIDPFRICAMLNDNVLLNQHEANFSLLTNISPRFGTDEVDQYMSSVSTDRSHQHSMVQRHTYTSKKDLITTIIKRVGSIILNTSQVTTDDLTAIAKISNISVENDVNILDLAIRSEKIHWGNLDFSRHGHLLEIPTLGILQDQLLNYFITRDVNYLRSCLATVEEHPTSFNLTNNGLSLTPLQFEWHGKDTIQMCKHWNEKNANFTHVNVQGFRLLTQACIFEVCGNSSDGKSPLDIAVLKSFVTEVKRNPIILEKLESSLCYDESVKFKIEELFKKK